MKALLYLTKTRLKNQGKELLRKPVRLIYVLVFLGLFILMLVNGGKAAPWRDYRDPQELAAIVFALYVFTFTIIMGMGFSRGGSLFRLSDVNFLFTAPISSQIVLFYGLLQQMTTSLLLGFFLIFQYSWLNLTYGITLGQLVWILLGYVLTVFLGQVTAMVLYAFTSADEQRQRWWAWGVYGWTVCVAAYILFRGLSGGLPELLPRVVETVTGGVGYFYPVAGWLSMAVGGGLTGEGGVLMGFGLCALYLAALLWILCKAKPDYYEDVLQSAEVSQSAINARKEGGMAEAAPQRVRLGRKGLNQGWGAGVIFVKHRIENRRTRKLLLSTNVLIFALMTIAMAFFLRGAGVMPIFGISVYTQIFTSMMGRLNLELRKPYLYLIPEPPMKKMLWALAEQFPAGLIEVLVVFVPVGVLMGLSPAMFAICVVARLSYTFLFAAANVAVDRLWGGVTSAVLVRLLFLAVAVAMALPGFIVGVIVSIATGFGAAAGLLAAMACNLPLGLLCLFLCRDMLQYAELNQQ